MNPHLLRKFRQRRDVLGVIDIIRNGRFIGDFTRATTRTYFDSTGTLQTAAINELPWEYDPTTGAALGYSFWEARTNKIRNNTGVGVVAGDIGGGGGAGTNWSVSVNTTTGLTRTVVGTSTEDGIYYTEFRIHGTASGAGSIDFFFDDANACAALTGQAWTESLYWRLISGSFTGISSPILYGYEYTAALAFVTTANFLSATLPTSAALRTQRISGTATLTGGATTAYLRPLLKMNIANGAAVDFTIRLGMQQLEQGSGATPVIATSGSAAARSADVASISGSAFSSLGIGSQGTIVVRAMRLAAPGAGVFPTTMSLTDGTSNNRVSLYTYSAMTCGISVNTGGVSQADFSAGTLVAGTFSKVGARFATNDIAASANGGAPATDTSATAPSIDRLYIGSINGSSNFWNGWIDYAGVLPALATTNQLQYQITP